MTETAVPPPDVVLVQTAPEGAWRPVDRSGVEVKLVPAGKGLRVEVAATGPLSRVSLRWRRESTPPTVVLGDAWERSYGELEWRSPRAERALPWMALTYSADKGRADGFGVEVRGGAFAFWQLDPAGVSLTLDLRSGGAAVRLGNRTVHAATVRWTSARATAFAAQCELAATLCRDPLLPDQPVAGANNWYYAYGKNFDAGAVVRDARTIAELAGDHPVRPFGVVDDGWSPDGTADGRAASGGPWDAGRAATFPSMPEVAAAIRAEGVRPGIWFRPLLRRDNWTAGARGPRDGGVALDPSSSAVLDVVGEDVRRLTEWGFDLIKHDFSTYDLLGLWGPTMDAAPTRGPALADPTVTTAEALVAFYTRFRESAGNAIVLGCNVVGHLAAGLVHAQRIGDDTSGVDWNRTRRVGVNTLAFRLAQHRRFFAVDPDCVPSTPHTDWSLNRQFLDLVARSGAVLFVSIDPETRTDAVDADLADALRLALDGGATGQAEPVDWLTSPTPSTWSFGQESVTYNWMGSTGADPFEPHTSATL